MERTPRHLLLATLLATSGALAFAQTPPPPAASTAPHAAQAHQRMAEHRDKRLAELKAQLKITPAQEAAWAAWTQATQPPAPAQRPPQARGEFARLTTPQRIDLMQQRQAERSARLRQRGDATKAFYAQLAPEQQKTFDQQALRHGSREGRPGPGHGKGHGPA
ncbi:MAG: Spy/CpxP family protein refolding chaperone [Ottowia sp.]|uniref:Spy/CpxP family protein refolding chaperone n=1 Tax=Ottowia sp. TaxID=1898956 RepID=UPI0039E2C90A